MIIGDLILKIFTAFEGLGELPFGTGKSILKSLLFIQMAGNLIFQRFDFI